jgi:hypothetical protein
MLHDDPTAETRVRLFVEDLADRDRREDPRSWLRKVDTLVRTRRRILRGTPPIRLVWGVERPPRSRRFGARGRGEDERRERRCEAEGYGGGASLRGAAPDDRATDRGLPNDGTPWYPGDGGACSNARRSRTRRPAYSRAFRAAPLVGQRAAAARRRKRRARGSGERRYDRPRGPPSLPRPSTDTAAQRPPRVPWLPTSHRSGCVVRRQSEIVWPRSAQGLGSDLVSCSAEIATAPSDGLGSQNVPLDHHSRRRFHHARCPGGPSHPH